MPIGEGPVFCTRIRYPTPMTLAMLLFNLIVSH